MSISFELPQDIEQELANRLGDLNEAAREAMAVELYRLGTLTHAEVARILGLSRYETDGVLKRHGVYYDITPQDVARDAETSRRARTQ